jgi:probable selenium-dependent hydroxylase accessory protein YqeC
MDLVEALSVGDLSCVVGAGGKKSTLYALAARLERAVITATVRIPIFTEHVVRVAVTDDPVATAGRNETWPIGVVPEREREDRYRGYEPETVAELVTAVDVPILVKADGARTRWLKTPNEREPRLPNNADTVLPIASARVVGEPLGEEVVHRPGRVGAITGLDLGEPIRPSDVATVLASSRGGLKSVPPGATVVPIVNMVDNADLENTGREIARKALEYTGSNNGSENDVTVSRVVLARMTDPDPVVTVIE